VDLLEFVFIKCAVRVQ